MRNLHKVFFLSLFAMALAAGCTVTTSDKGGQGGEDTFGTGGRTSAGGNTSVGGTNASGGTATTAFSAADCATAAATVPAEVPDVTSACIACIYGSTGCADAVTCRNDGACMTSTLKALECIELYFLYNTVADPDAVQACQDGTLTAADTPTAAQIAAGGFTVKSTDAGAWLGAVVPTNGTAVLVNCALECHLSDT